MVTGLEGKQGSIDGPMTVTAGPPWRVLFTIPNFVTAGSGETLANLAEGLDPATFTAMVAAARTAGAPLEERLLAAGIDVLELDLRVAPKPYVTLGLRAWRMSRKLRALDVSVVHSFDYSDLYTEAIVARMAGAKYVSVKKNMGWGSRAWFLRSLFSDRIAVQNVAMLRRFFSNRLLRSRVRFIPPGVVVDNFSPRGDRDAFRAELGLPANAIVVTSVANIGRNKNQELLIRALPADERVHLLLVGPNHEPDYWDELVALAASLGVSSRVTLTGGLADVRPALWSSDVFALVSRKEGSPVAILEAMSARLPILASAIPGVTEFLQGSVAATLVDPDDVDAAAQALASLCGDESLRRGQGRAGEVQVQDRSIRVEVARTESMYFELLWTSDHS